MKRRTRHLLALVMAAASAVAAAACVDLFHGTDFETLCTREPQNGACPQNAEAEGGAEAAAPVVDTRSLCEYSDDEIERYARHACAWLGACEGSSGPKSFSACMTNARYALDCKGNPSYRPQQNLESFWRCLVNAKTCREVDGCVFGGAAPSCSFKDAGEGKFTSCGGGAAGAASLNTECSADGERPSFVEVCATSGRACANVGTSTACLGPLGQGSCTADSTGCKNDTEIVDCQVDGGVGTDRGVDCAAFGAGRCSTSGAGSSACVPSKSALPCTGETLSCAGNKILGCVQGKSVSLDCVRFGRTCTTGDIARADTRLSDGGARGAPLYELLSACNAPVAGCDSEQCAGTILSACVQGARRDIDCVGLGLGPCRMNGDRASCSAPP